MRAYLEIEMPKDGCTNCPLARRGSIFSRICVITEEYVDGNYERGGFPTECPLQELLPHARLIDEDVLKMKIDKQIKKWGPLPVYVSEVLENVPTAIPASKEKT